MLHDHAAAFYDDDREIVDMAARFVAEGLRHRSSTVIAATPEHRAAIEQALLAMGLNPDQPPVAGHLIMLDARRTLSSLLNVDVPDPDRFTDTIARLLRDASTDGAPVRVFDETVDLLWNDGDRTGAMALEGMWNGMLQRTDCVVVCAYSHALVDSGVLADVHAVCSQHSDVQAPARYLAPITVPVTSPRVFLPVGEAVASSRQFVDACLRRMGAPDHLVHDARLIVSELATNAVLHARSPFRISVEKSADGVCLSVQDMSSGPATRRDASVAGHSLDGRGIGIIDSLARRWGCNLLADGKVVWAELTA